MSQEMMTNTMTEEQLIEEMPEAHKKETEDSLSLALYEFYKESIRKRLDLIRVLHSILEDFGPNKKPTMMRQDEQRMQSDAAMVKAMADRVMDMAQMVLEQNKNRQ